MSEVNSYRVAMWKTEIVGAGGINGMLTTEVEVMGNLVIIIIIIIINSLSLHVLGFATENLELSGHSLMEM
jgi:hypothetical protein